MKHKKTKEHVPLTWALAWIIGSTFIFTGISYTAMKWYFKKQWQDNADPKYLLRKIVQTGPQKEALKTEYLAELLGLSVDQPCSVRTYDLKEAKKKLLSSPLIQAAELKLIKPCSLYIDYTARKPIALIDDYTNVALDKEGYLFPLTPFFTPKNLPHIYLGLAPFGVTSSDPDRDAAHWNKPFKGKCYHLAVDILNTVNDPKIAHLFEIKRIDVSNAFSESYGTREIVLILEDEGNQRILKLSTKNYAQELGNYLKLREQLSADPQEKMIDFRIPHLAYIE